MSHLEILFKTNMVDFIGEIQNICCPNDPKIFIVKNILENAITPEACMKQFEKSFYIHKPLIDSRDLGILTKREIWDKFHPYVGDLIDSIDIRAIPENELDCLWAWMDNFCKFIDYRQKVVMV